MAINLSVQAPVDRIERWRTNTRWGNLKPSTLADVLARSSKGDVADLVDLSEYAIGSDPRLTSWYDSRITRVLQADFGVKPSPFGDPKIAKMAADLVNECIARIPDWHQVQRDLLHAIAVGHALGENEWAYDETLDLNYVTRIDFRHGHRFRYDEVWQLRLYDQGAKHSVGSMYGEALVDHKWTVHQYRVQAGYPGIGGIMRSCLWPWLFGRMSERWWVTSTERNGQPFWRAEVPKGTTESTRLNILSQLEGLSGDHVAVLEEDVKIIADATAAASKSWEGYVEFLKDCREGMELAWLGMKDATGPGENGSRGATEARTGAMLDPRMVADGINFGGSLESTLIRSMIACNAHRFPVPVERVPIPLYRYLTNDDTTHTQTPVNVVDLLSIVTAVKTGQISRESAVEMIQLANPGVTEEQARKVLGVAPPRAPGAAAPAPAITQPVATPAAPAAPAPAPAAAPAAPDVPKLAEQALNGAQVSSLLEIVQAVASGVLTEASAVALIEAAGLVTDPAKARAIVSGASAPTAPAEPTDPKAQTPAPQPGQVNRQASRLASTKTPSRSPSPFAKTVRRASATSTP
jgi:phage gp29-like protein